MRLFVTLLTNFLGKNASKCLTKSQIIYKWKKVHEMKTLVSDLEFFLKVLTAIPDTASGLHNLASLDYKGLLVQPLY